MNVSRRNGSEMIMNLVRAIARPMLASTFVTGGFDTVRKPERVAPVAEPLVRPLADRVTALPDRTEHFVRFNGAVQLVAGVLLGIGVFPRSSALAIAATLVPTTLAGHRFWEIEDAAERAQQRIQFFKNLSMLGGLLIAAGVPVQRPQTVGDDASRRA